MPYVVVLVAALSVDELFESNLQPQDLDDDVSHASVCFQPLLCGFRFKRLKNLFHFFHCFQVTFVFSPVHYGFRLK